MYKIIRLLACLFLLNTAFADSKTKNIQLELAKIVRTPAFVEEVLNGYGLVGMPREVAREHVQELYKNNDVIIFIVKEMLNAGADKWDIDKSSDYGKRFGAELFTSYSMKGMRRLSFEEQRFFIQFMVNWMKIASDDDCKKMLTSGGATSSLDDANIEIKYYYRVKREELRSYFSMLRKSIIAEIVGYPYVKSINQQQAKIADDAFQNELAKSYKNGLIDDETLLAMADMSSANSKLACSAGKLIFSTILSMKGFSGELMLSKFVNSLQ